MPPQPGCEAQQALAVCKFLRHHPTPPSLPRVATQTPQTIAALPRRPVPFDCFFWQCPLVPAQRPTKHPPTTRFQSGHTAMSASGHIFDCDLTATFRFVGERPHCRVASMKAYSVRDIAAVAKSTRKRLGLTQANLAAKTGVGREWVIEFEKGKSSVELGYVLRILRVLGLSLDVQPEVSPSEKDDCDLERILQAHSRRQPSHE